VQRCKTVPVHKHTVHHILQFVAVMAEPGGGDVAVGAFTHYFFQSGGNQCKNFPPHFSDLGHF